ncbi:MAG: hypothetical protein ACI379_05350 [Nocardioides sp.]|uniref:hypothetical protein n=1 Tax=Nocardioides sp. TaxID=35761 RepID=UPI003F0E67D3
MRRTATCLLLAAALALTACTTSAGDDQDRRDASVAAEAAQRTGLETAPRLPGKVLDTVGVVTANSYWRVTPEQAADDWRRLTARRDVDLIGWQEANSAHFRSLADEYAEKGWTTWQYEGARTSGPVALAITYRSDVWELGEVTWQRVHGLQGRREAQDTDDKFPPRWIVVAELTHRASGRTVTLVNTHLDHAIETGQEFADTRNGRAARKHLRMLATVWRTAPGEVVVGTGDYNFDHHDDSVARPQGGITDLFDGLAVSSYEALGYAGLTPSLRTRWIDYVFLTAASLKGESGTGTAQFARHRVLEGYHADHHPVLARIRLYR